MLFCRYQVGANLDFSEMTGFSELQSFKIMIDNDPGVLHLSPCLSDSTALHTIELRRSFTATHYQPIIRSFLMPVSGLRVHACPLCRATSQHSFITKSNASVL